MKKISLLVMSVVCALALPAYADLTEDFNSAKGTWTTDTQVTLPSGEWTFGGGAQANTSNGISSTKRGHPKQWMASFYVLFFY